MKKKILKILKIIFILIIITTLWIVWGNINIQKTHISIKNSKIPKPFNGYKIAVVSDLHNHDWGDRLPNMLREENPDIIAVTGDLIDLARTDVDIAMEFIEKSKDIAQIYYVTGNHEAWTPQYENLKKRMIEQNVVILDDNKLYITKEGESLTLLGLQDIDFLGMFDGFIKDWVIRDKLFNLIPKDDSYKILLSHRPEIFDLYVENEVDLVLAGHAHGGQVRLPFIGGLLAPNQGFFPRYTSGVYTENKTDMVVSRGLGNSVMPIRVNNMPELVLITLENE